MKNRLVFILIIFPLSIYPNGDSFEPDWGPQAELINGKARSNIFRLNPGELAQAKKKGLQLALHWPVPITGLFIPYRPFKKIFYKEQIHTYKKNLIIPFKKIDEFYEWLGLSHFPKPTVPSIFRIPYPEPREKPYYRMGASIIDHPEFDKGLTFSCTTCHMGVFISRPIFGLTNKRSRANQLFYIAKKTLPIIPAHLFKHLTNPNPKEFNNFKRTKYNLKFVDTVKPQILGLKHFPSTRCSIIIQKKGRCFCNHGHSKC